MTDYTQDLANARRPHSDIVTAGQPSADQLAAAADQGVKTVVNLRPVGEFDEFDEAAHVRDLGMRYVHIPVAGPDDINDANARTLDEALGADGVPAMVHCASSNRVGALMAYRARHIQDKSADQAMEIGQASGLNKQSPLFDATRAKLG